jgi:hypothetical protein
MEPAVKVFVGVAYLTPPNPGAGKMQPKYLVDGIPPIVVVVDEEIRK